MAEMPNISVEVTDAIHSAFRDVAQRIFDQHGIVIKNVQIEWLDTSTRDRADGRVLRVETYASKTY